MRTPGPDQHHHSTRATGRRDGKGVGAAYTARFSLLACVLLSLMAAAPATARARTMDAATSPVSASGLALSVDNASSTASVAGASGAAASPYPVYTGAHQVRMTELDHLVHSAQGRALLRSSLGAAVLHAIEGGYGVDPSSSVAPLAPPLSTRRAAAARARLQAPRIAAPTLDLWPRGVAPGAHLAVAVRNAFFAPGEQVVILLDGRMLTSVVANARGLAPSIGSIAPASTRPGAHRLTVVGLRSGRRVAGLLRVYGLSAARARVVPGGALLLRGAGFAPGQVVRFMLHRASGRALPLGFGGTDAAGMLVPLRLNVPFTAVSGHAMVVASDAAGEQTAFPLTVGTTLRRSVTAPVAFVPAPRIYGAPTLPRSRVYSHVARRPAAMTPAPRLAAKTLTPTRHAAPRHTMQGGASVRANIRAVSPSSTLRVARAAVRAGASPARRVRGARAPAAPFIYPLRAALAPRAPGAHQVSGLRPHVVAAAPAVTSADTGCYHQSEAGFTFDSMYCPVSSTNTVTNVVVTPPSLLGVQTPITLPSVTLGSDGKPALPLQLPDLNITESGFSVSAVTNTLTTSGLTIGAIGLTLPATLGGLTLSARNVAIGTDGSIGGSVSLTPDPLTVSYAGFDVTLTGVSLTQQGIGAAQISVAIPSDLLPKDIPNVPTNLSVNNVQINFDGTITSGSGGGASKALTLPAFTGVYGGFDVSLKGVSIGLGGLTVGDAELGLPSSLLPSGASPLTVTGALTITRGGGASISIVGVLALGPTSLALAGFTVAVDGVTLSNAGLALTNARLTLPANLFPAGSTPPVLTGNLSITPAFSITGSLTTGAFSIPIAGFTVSTDGITLSNAGLVVSNARLTLPASLFPAGATLPVLTGNLSIDQSFKVAASLTTGPAAFSVAGFVVSTDGITLTTGGLTVGAARLALPPGLLPAGSTAPVLTGNLAVDSNFKVTASLTTGSFAILVAGFTIASDGVTLSNAGLVVSNARLILPTSLFPTGSTPPVLTGNLSITPAFSVTGSLATGAFSIPIDGFTVSADGITLSNAGLVVSNARLAFPASLFPTGSTPPVLTGNLSITPAFSVTASLTTGPFSIPVDGFTIASDGITLSNSGLVVSNARLTLPASFLPEGSSPITLVGSLAVDANFKVTAALSTTNVTIAYGGYKFHVDSIVLSNSGLVIGNATLVLPADLGGGTVVGALTVTPSFAVNGTLALFHPSFAFHGVTVSADSIGLALTSSQTAGTTVAFQIVNAKVVLPQDVGGLTLVGNLTASFGTGGTRIVGQLSTTNVHFTYRGFTVDSGVVTLDNNGIRASGVKLTLPATFNVNGQSVVLTGALGLDIVGGKTTFTGSLGIQNVSLSVYGFTASVGSLTIGTDGLVLLNASLSLPQAVSALLKVDTLSLSSLTITRDYQVTATANSLSFSLAGASISTGPLSVGTGGIVASNASVTLPARLGGATFTMPNLGVSPSGDTSGAVSGKSIGFNVGGLAVSASGFGFKNGAIVIAQLSASLPVFQEGLTLQGLSFDGHHISLTGGTAMITLPPINAGGFTISAQALLSFSEVGGALTFDIVGSGTINIPSLGAFHCALEVGSVDANHPSHLYSAELDVQLHAGIPLGVGPFQSGLELNGINGGIRIGRNAFTGAALVTLQLGLDVGTDDGGYLFEGNVTGAVATDGNFGVGGGGAFLSGLIQMSGGFCLRFSAQNDGVCGVVMHNNGARIDASGSTGFYAEVTFGKTVHVRKDITIQASAYAHIWRDGDGPEASADIAATVNVPSSSLLPAIPPKSFNLNASGQLGKFRKGNDIYRGMKLSLTYHLLGRDHTYSLFVDSNGNAHVGASNYTIIDAGANTGYLLTNLPNGVTMASRLANRTPAAPLHRGEMQARLRILPGQSNGLFTLYWRRGAPLLTLVAPDGARYSQSARGVAIVSTKRGRLPTGYSGGATIAPPVLEPGVWTIQIGNLRGDERYKLTVDAANPQPRLRVTAPAGGQTAVASPTTLIRGTLEGPTTAKTVSLYYTTSRTSVVTGTDSRPATVPNLSGAALAEGVAVHNGAFSYPWDTRALPRGLYYVYAVLDNGFDAEVVAYARGRIAVRQPARPGAPRSVVAARRGSMLHIVWSPPSRTSILAGYKLYWRTSAMASGAYHVLDLGNTQSFDLGETRPHVRYEAAVSAYDLSGAQSGKTPAAMVVENRGGATFRASAPGGSIRAGGTIVLPLSLVTRGAATGRLADYADVSIGALPVGVTVVPTLRTANLFTRFERDDPSAPALTVQTSAFASPTTPNAPILIPVTVRQESTGRTVVTMVPLIIRTGAPGQLNMWYGTPTRRPDGLMSVPVVAKVVDRSGNGAIDGTDVAFTAVDGVVKKADVTTTATTPTCVTVPQALCGPTASIKGGFAATTVVYAPGTHPYVTGDTGTAVGVLYIGADPVGASRSRYFAITESAAARRHRAQDGLRITNALDAAAHVRIDYWTQRPHDYPRQHIDILLVGPHSAIVAPLDPASTAARHLSPVEAPRGLTLGVHVISDLPVLSEQVVRRDVNRGVGALQGFSHGVDEVRIASRWTFRLPAGRASIDLYTAKTRAVTVRVTGRTRDGQTASTRVPLVPHGSALIDVDALFAAHHIRPHGVIVVSVTADKAFAAEPQL